MCSFGICPNEPSFLKASVGFAALHISRHSYYFSSANVKTAMQCMDGRFLNRLKRNISIRSPRSLRRLRCLRYLRSFRSFQRLRSIRSLRPLRCLRLQQILIQAQATPKEFSHQMPLKRTSGFNFAAYFPFFCKAGPTPISMRNLL